MVDTFFFYCTVLPSLRVPCYKARRGTMGASDFSHQPCSALVPQSGNHAGAAALQRVSFVPMGA